MEPFKELTERAVLRLKWHLCWGLMAKKRRVLPTFVFVEPAHALKPTENATGAIIQRIASWFGPHASKLVLNLWSCTNRIWPLGQDISSNELETVETVFAVSFWLVHPTEVGCQ